MALSSKLADKKLFIIDSEKTANAKTKELKAKLDAFGWKKVLFVGGETLDNNFMLALKNIINSDALPSQGANVYDILKHDTLVLTKDAVENLTKRLSK